MQKAGRQIDYKKRRSDIEFLYILPFLILVALFSYFPLYGWIYAFHDYRPPFPITNETFVGFKWFATIVNNPVRLPVLKTMYMSAKAPARKAHRSQRRRQWRDIQR